MKKYFLYVVFIVIMVGVGMVSAQEETADFMVFRVENKALIITSFDNAEHENETGEVNITHNGFQYVYTVTGNQAGADYVASEMMVLLNVEFDYANVFPEIMPADLFITDYAQLNRQVLRDYSENNNMPETMIFVPIMK